MNERLRAIVLVLLGSLLFFSCATIRHLLGVVADKPTVRLVNVDVLSIDPRRMDLDFVLEIYNPNSFSVDIQELKYDVKSMSLDLGEGSYPDLITLKAKDKVEVKLPLRVNPESIVNLMKRYLANPKELKVEFRSDLFLHTAFGKLDMHFHEEKTIMKGLAPQ
jgi:LEA14-like dessication related protein